MNKTKDNKVVVAQIGVGYWGPNLLRNLVSNPEFIVKKVIDKVKDRREFVNSRYPGIKVSQNIEDVMSDPAIDAVVLATPVGTHFDLTIQALRAGKHVLVEKPMATQLEEVEEIQNEASQRELVAMVGHTFIFNSAVRYIKDIIDKKQLGDIRYIYSQRVNLGRIRSDVDAMWNLAPHDISIIQYWLGDPKPLSLSRTGMSYIQNGIDDVVFLTVTYPNNVMSHIHVSWLDPHKIRRMTVVGSKKMAVYDDMSDSKVAIYDKGIDPLAVLGESMDYDHPATYQFDHRSGDILLPKIHSIEPLQTEIQHFADCILKGTTCLAGPAHAASVVEILSQA